MIVDLRAQHARQAAQVKQRIASRLRSGQGVGGQRLEPKAKPDGRPLGGSLPVAIVGAPVAATQRGFAIAFDDATSRFHHGAPGHGQPARPIVGLTRSESAALAREDAALAARQITRHLRSGL